MAHIDPVDPRAGRRRRGRQLGACTWAAAAWKHSPARARPALAGVRAQLAEAAGLVDPGDVRRPGRAPVSQEPPRLFLTIRSHPSSLSSDEDILHPMKPVRRCAGQEHFRSRASSESRGGSRGKCRTCQGSDLRRWVTPSAMFRLTAIAHQLELRSVGPSAGKVPVSRAESGQARCIGASARSARGAQVLVDGLAADAELTSQCCLRDTRAGRL